MVVVGFQSLALSEFFKSLLSQSKRDFHEMFKRTYGILYEQNSYVFTDLFEELERYYSKGQVDLAEAMDNFFNTLYQKMFTVLNAQYSFDDKYLGCVGEHMKELSPFGDVPHKLSVQLKRSFVATRTFSQALGVASEVVNNMGKIPPSAECVRALTKMTGCPACQGLPDLKACSNYCINVMKGCLSYHTELDTEWNNFVDSMDKVTDRLMGPFNIEMVVEPINIKISEAIMNFQENGPEVSQRVFSGCGKPTLQHHRRRRDTTELKFESLQFSQTSAGSLDKGNNGPTLDRLVKDIRQKVQNLSEGHEAVLVSTRGYWSSRARRCSKHSRGSFSHSLLLGIFVQVKDTKQFWSHMPYHICNNDNVAASPTKDDSCWNGAMKARYEPHIAGDGLMNQNSNPEVPVDVNRPSTLLNEQLFTLRTITSKLKNAYNGQDVEWIDYEESSYGSGSGSGDGIDDTKDDVEGSGNFGTRVEVNSNRELGSKPIRPTNINTNSVGENTIPAKPKNTTAGTPAAVHRHMSVTRAVATYLLPIVVIWFGGIFSDWL
uniref:Glypican-6 n=1 Tax=Timema genevievae TaxID=629358 RepID=A0A7R9PPF4_TIMGE|nr:unnamed protein product [Timema genevievae]